MQFLIINNPTEGIPILMHDEMTLTAMQVVA